MTKLSSAAFVAKYNDASTGLFKTGQSRGIGSDDMRVFVTDLMDSLASLTDTGYLRDQGGYDASGTPTTGIILYPSSGGSGAGGAIRRFDTWIVTVADGSFNAPVGSLLICVTTTPGQDNSKWRIL